MNFENLSPSEKLAWEAISEQNPNAAFDPSVILVYAEIILQVMEMFRDSCGLAPGEALDRIGNRRLSIWDNWLLNSVIRRQLGFRDYRRHGGEIKSALLAKRKRLSLGQVEELYNEASLR